VAPDWKRIQEIHPGAQFIIDGIAPSDVLRGSLHDSYIFSAITAVAECPARIGRLFPPIRSRSPTGVYMVRLMVDGVVQEVIVDDYIPVNTRGQPFFAQIRKGEFWPLILEKAIAKVNGSYANILEGQISNILRMVTWSPTSTRVVAPEFSQPLWNTLTHALRESYVVCATAHEKQHKEGFDNHTYTLASISPDKMVTFKNPYARA
jgi:hypothetical protein